MSNNHLRKVVYHIVLFGSLLAYSYSFRSTLIDDAFIQFQYAKILSTTGGWGFFPGITTNTATSPLNVIVLSFLSIFTRNAVTAAILLTAIEFYFLFIFLIKLSEHLFTGKGFAVLAFVSLIANPLLLSTLGMESWLLVPLFAIALYLFVKEKWSGLAIVVGLLTLARPDGILLTALLFVMTPSNKKLRFAWVYILTVTPWFIFSWVHLGSFVPDTLLIKMGQGDWEGRTFSSGLAYFYFRNYPVATYCSFLLLPFVLLSFFAKNRDVRKIIRIIGLFVLLHYAGYSFLHVPPYHWYYVPLVAGSALIGSLAVASFVQRFAKINVTVFVLIPIFGFVVLAHQNGFPFTEAPIHTNWATKTQYEEIGLWLRSNIDPAAVCTLGGEIGTLAYYSDRRLINNFSNPGELFRLVQKFRRTKGTVMRTMMKWNYVWRRKVLPDPPAAFNLTHFVNQNPYRTPDVIMSWHTSSSWIREGTLVLKKINSR